jgi:hypothetical protein
LFYSLLDDQQRRLYRGLAGVYSKACKDTGK